GDGRACHRRPRGTRARHAAARRLPRLAPARVQPRSHPNRPRLSPSREVAMLATASRSTGAAEARELILSGSAPADLEVEGSLEFRGVRGLRLPDGLKARRLRLIDC